MIRLQHLKTYGPNKGYERELWLADVDGQVHRVLISHSRVNRRNDYILFLGDAVTENAGGERYAHYLIDESGQAPSPRRIAEFVADGLKLEQSHDYEVGPVSRQVDVLGHRDWVGPLDQLARIELQTIVDRLLDSGHTDSNGHHDWSQGAVDNRLDELLQFREAHRGPVLEAPVAAPAADSGLDL